MNEEQKREIHEVFSDIREVGLLDYVTGWYIKTAKYIKNTRITAAFVSTNSISQGEQVGILWEELFKHGVRIRFAHRTFKWTNEAPGRAAVYCIILGFGLTDPKEKFLFEYLDVSGDPHAIAVKNINPYLVDAPNVVVRNRQRPLCDVPEMSFGSMPRGGDLVLSEEERLDLIQKEPGALKYIRPYIGAQEFLYNERRYCLWLVDIEPSALRKLPEVLKRVNAVKVFRLSSKASSTRKMAETAHLFAQNTQPKTDYILIPSTSSENRRYIPMGFFSPETIASNSCHTLPLGKLYHFGVLQSLMHMTWVSYVCGRLESRYRYSKDIVYNNFPWPLNSAPKLIKAVEVAAQSVLDSRNRHPNSSLADLYDPLTMPKDLRESHAHLDRLVDECYGKKNFKTEAERIELLFSLYKEYTNN
jgi:hypothetical protein